MPVASTEPPLGPVESSAKSSVVLAKLSATSRPVTVSEGELLAPALQLNVFDTNGPPAGVLTSEEMCDQPPEPPANAVVALGAGPESASATAFLIVNDPAAAPR